MSTGSDNHFIKGLRDGIPIAMGYFAVAMSIGVAARDSGFTPAQTFISGMLLYASAGQYAGFTLYAAGASLVQLLAVTLITNIRYTLMGFALQQKVRPGTPVWKRAVIGASITDEIFGITVVKPGYINYLYPAGAWWMAVPVWSLAMALGVYLGNLLPETIISALSVALYGMFIAIIIPPAKKDRIVAVFIVIAFAASFLFSKLEPLSSISEGTRTIILTVGISSAAAIFFPRKEENKDA